jgi:hypothetical protein
MRRRKWAAVAAATAALVVVVAVGALAETVYVKTGSVPMLDKPDVFKGQLIKRLPFGEAVERLEKGEKWDKVRSGGRIGYVRSGNLVTRKPCGTKPEKTWGGKREGTQSGAVAGLRGLDKFGKDYAKAHDFEKGVAVVENVMDKMKIDPEKLDKFQRNGRVGDYSAPGGEK